MKQNLEKSKGIYNWRYIAFARLTERTSKLYCSMMANTNSRMHIYRSHKINPFIWTHSIFFVFTYRLTQYCNSKSELLLAIMVLDILQTWTKIYITGACAWNIWQETFTEWFNGYILLSFTLFLIIIQQSHKDNTSYHWKNQSGEKV